MANNTSSGRPSAALIMDKKIVKQDHKHYLIPAHLELHELSPGAQEFAHKAYLALKPAAKPKPKPKVVLPKPPINKPTSSTQLLMALMLALTPKPTPLVSKAEVNKIDPKLVVNRLQKPTRQRKPLANLASAKRNQNTIQPGVPIPPVLMAALLRYNGLVAQQAKQLSHLNLDHTATPTPFNTKPKLKPW